MEIFVISERTLSTFETVLERVGTRKVDLEHVNDHQLKLINREQVIIAFRKQYWIFCIHISISSSATVLN